MKKILLILVLSASFITGSYAQDEGGDGGRLQAYKIAFLTKRLNLSPEEAQRFWPIYNKYENEIRSARKDGRGSQGKEIETEEKILNIRKKYNDEFARALSGEKVNTLFRSEREFGNMVQKELLDRRQRLDNRSKLRN